MPYTVHAAVIEAFMIMDRYKYRYVLSDECIAGIRTGTTVVETLPLLRMMGSGTEVLKKNRKGDCVQKFRSNYDGGKSEFI